MKTNYPLTLGVLGLSAAVIVGLLVWGRSRAASSPPSNPGGGGASS